MHGLEKRLIRDVENMSIQNLIITFSMLYPHWIIAVSCFIVVIETLVLNIFWKNFNLSLKVSFLANIGSALIAVPFLAAGTAGGSLWVNLINDTELLITEGEIYIFFSLVIFMIAMLISILIEVIISKALKAPKDKLFISFILANLGTYSAIIGTLIGLGAWFGFTNSDPTLDSWDFYEGILFQTVPVDSTSLIIQQGMLFFGILVLLFSLVWNYQNSFKKIISWE
jgi:hypothetical protein